MLIILGGLPGTAKTAIARELARQLGAVYLRIDSIEQAIRDFRAVSKPLDDAGSHGWASVRPTDMVGCYSSEIRTGCANKRSSGSVRGAPGNWCPYRDRQSADFLSLGP
jgi:hypothetical protein